MRGKFVYTCYVTYQCMYNVHQLYCKHCSSNQNLGHLSKRLNFLADAKCNWNFMIKRKFVNCTLHNAHTKSRATLDRQVGPERGTFMFNMSLCTFRRTICRLVVSGGPLKYVLGIQLLCMYLVNEILDKCHAQQNFAVRFYQMYCMTCSTRMSQRGLVT